MLNFMPKYKLYHNFITNNEKLHCSICITIKRVDSPLLGIFISHIITKYSQFFTLAKKISTLLKYYFVHT